MVLFGRPATTPLQHLTLTVAERGDAFPDHVLGVLARHLGGREVHGTLDRFEQDVVFERLLDEIERAALHRFDRHLHVTVAGDDDCRQQRVDRPQAAQQLDPVDVGHPRSVIRHPLLIDGAISRNEVADSCVRTAKPELLSRKASEFRTASSSSTMCTTISMLLNFGL
jgi:hypothetical protein